NFDKVVSELEDVIRPKPNSKLGVYFHYKVQREKPGFINRFFNKRMGEEPVYESHINPQHTKDVINNRLENNGFFMNTISSEIVRNEKKKKSKAVYKINVG